MMTSGSCITSISPLNMTPHVPSKKATIFSSACSDSGYADMSAARVSDTTVGASPQYSTGSHGCYTEKQTHGSDVDRPSTRSCNTDNIVQVRNAGRHHNVLNYSQVLFQEPNYNFITSNVSDSNLSYKQDLSGYYITQGVSSTQFPGIVHGNTASFNTALQSFPSSSQRTLHKTEPSQNYTQQQQESCLQPHSCQKFSTNQLTVESGYHRMPALADVCRLESFHDRLSAMKYPSIRPILSAPSSFSRSGDYLSDVEPNLCSWPGQVTDHTQFPSSRVPRVYSADHNNVSPLAQGTSQSLTCPPDFPRPGAGRGAEPGHRQARSVGAGQPGSTWTAKGDSCSVTLYNGDMWAKFHSYTNEMIITKHGRRMFPILHFKITGLDPDKQYSVYVDMVLADNSHWKFQGGKWVACGRAEPLPTEGRTYHHTDSPNTGAHWMKQDVTFSKLKLTNNKSSKQKQIILNSMHRYQPQIYVTEFKDGKTGDVLLSHGFPDTQFIAVTAYQNTDITDLKVKFNPYARGMQDKNRMGLHDSRNGESPQTAVNHSVGASKTSQSPSSSYICQENVPLAAQVSSGVSAQVSSGVSAQVSSGVSAQVTSVFLGHGYIQHNPGYIQQNPEYTQHNPGYTQHGLPNVSFTASNSSTYQSTNNSSGNSNSITFSDTQNYHPNFLEPPAAHQHVSQSESFQNPGYTSSQQSQIYQLSYPGYETRSSRTLMSADSDSETCLKTLYQRGSNNASTTDIVHGSILPQLSDSSDILNSNPYSHGTQPGTSLWPGVFTSGHAVLDGKANYNINTDLAEANFNPTLRLVQERDFREEKSTTQGFYLPMTDPASDHSFLSSNSLITSSKTPSSVPPTNLSCQSERKCHPTQTGHLEAFSIHSSCNKFGQQSCLSIDSSLKGESQMKFFSYDSKPSTKTQLQISGVEATRLRQLQNDFYSQKQKMSMTGRNEASPSEETELQKSSLLPLVSTSDVDTEKAAKEFRQLQREAAKLSLDFMSHDDLPVSAFIKSSSPSVHFPPTTPLSTAERDSSRTPTTVSSASPVRLFDLALSNDDLRNVTQGTSLDILSKNNDSLNSECFHKQTKKNDSAVDDKNEKCLHPNSSYPEDIAQSISVDTGLVSIEGEKQTKSLKRNGAEPNKEMGCKKIKSSPAVIIV